MELLLLLKSRSFVKESSEFLGKLNMRDNLIVLEKTLASFPYGAGIAAVLWRLGNLLCLIHRSQCGHENVSKQYAEK